MPQRIGWPLQEPCKRHGDTVGLCRNSASRAYLSEWKNVTYNVKGNR